MFKGDWTKCGFKSNGHKCFMKMNGTKSLRNPKNPFKNQTRDSIFKNTLKKGGAETRQKP